MRHKAAWIAVAALFSSAHAEPQYGPESSPLAFEAAGHGKVQEAVAPTRLLGVTSRPVSAKQGLFRDQRPYGGNGAQNAVLLRYELLAISGGGFNMTATLSLAFDATGNLLCAFTDPAANWLRSYSDSSEIEKRTHKNFDFAPAHYVDLHSTLHDVLVALRANYGVDPSKAGQIVIRPRFMTDKRDMRRAATHEPIVPPPCNVWVVEVLGTPIDFPSTILVAKFRDGDLEMLHGELLP